MSQSMKVQLQIPYLKKHVATSKISRLKLQDEFACRGWNTCSSPFGNKSGESEYDIVASPTKYPFSKKSNVHENYSKKKPMLLEISNIESVFLQNKQNSSNDVKRLSETFYNFVPKLTKQGKLNVINHRKRTHNFHESSKNKKHCSEFPENSSKTNFLIASSNISKKNSSKNGSFADINEYKKVSDFFNDIEPNDTCNIKSVDSQRITKEKCIKHKLKIPNVPPTSLPLNSELNEILKAKLDNNKNNQNQNSDSCLEDLQFSSSKDSHVLTNLISDFSSVREKYCSEKMSLKNLKKFPSTLKNGCTNVSDFIISNSPVCIQDESTLDLHVKVPCSPSHLYACNSNKNEKLISDSANMASATIISNSPISIQNENSPESSAASIISCSPVHFQPYDTKEHKGIMSVHRKNHLHSQPLKLQDLQETFQIKNDEESFISDCSPIKEKNNKHIFLNITNKFKILSEAFINTTGDVKLANNDSSNKSIQSAYCPSKAEYKKILSMSKIISSFKDETVNAVNECEVSEAKSVAVDNKIFMKTIQSSFQEKSTIGDKGSNWVQTLNWDQFSQSKDVEYECNNQIGKKSLKSIIHGGFAEHMLKLQRRERSDSVIWNHKMSELKKKGSTNLITFTVMSVLHIGQIIMTKSTTNDINNEYFKDFLNNDDFNFNSQITADDNPKIALSESLPFIVLFKREIFTKMCLKVGDDFSLYPPWQFLSVPSLPFPVILCTYFVEAIIKDEKPIQKEPSKVQYFPVLYKSLPKKACDCDEPVLSNYYLCNSSDLYSKAFCIPARVQRVWKSTIANNRLLNILKIFEYNFSLLLQTQDGIFLELKINSSYLPDAYLEFLSDAEGKCFRFCNAVISHRYNLKTYNQLKSFVEYIQNHITGNNVLPEKQLYYYQLMPSSFDKIPCDIAEEHFQFYCDYDIQPLSFLQKNIQRGARFSCIGKIIFQDKEDFYITDESLLCSKEKKYYLLKIENIFRTFKESLIGAIVLVKEAIDEKNYLFIDKFSSCDILSSSKADKKNERIRLLFDSRMKKIDLITYEHILSPLSLSSKIQELTFVKGIITQVDESTAVSWLECSFCFGENLLEDSNSIIYCEDCACIIPKPVLKVKMDVMVQDTCLSPAKVKVQLLSSTIKKILKISEDNYQPECNISDVLKKNTGVLCCYIRDIEVTEKLTIFHLREISSS